MTLPPRLVLSLAAFRVAHMRAQRLGAISLSHLSDSQQERVRRYTAHRPAEGCWHWGGGRTREGYGSISLTLWGRAEFFHAHRLVYMLAIGGLPSGHVVQQICRNPVCVRPSHLEAMSRRDHVIRGGFLGATGALRRFDSRLKATAPDAVD